MKTSFANETPILNALTRPYLVQTSDRQTLEEHAESIVRDRVTYIEAESIMRHCEAEKLGYEPGAICPLPGGVWLESSWPLPIAVLARPHPIAAMLDRSKGGTLTDEGAGVLRRAMEIADQEMPQGFAHAREALATSMWIYCAEQEGGRTTALCECWFVADPSRDLQLARPHGQCCTWPWMTRTIDPSVSDDTMRLVLVRCVAWASRTFAFMNATGNISIRDGGFTNDHVSKKRRDAHRLPWIRRKVLKLRRPDGREEDLFPRHSTGAIPVHMVRGHFVRYGRRRPHEPHKTFWRRGHVRGNAEVGVVVKDYELDADEPAETNATPALGRH